jgi:hypothetical protein
MRVIKTALVATQRPRIKQVVCSISATNNEEVVQEMNPRFKDCLGESLFEMAPDPGSDEFARLADPHIFPTAYQTFGKTTNAEE